MKQYKNHRRLYQKPVKNKKDLKLDCFSLKKLEFSI